MSEKTLRYPPISVVDRIKELAVVGFVSEASEFSYTWRGGYETLMERREGGGSIEYSGVYHPDDGYCVGRGICEYCGRTLFDD